MIITIFLGLSILTLISSTIKITQAYKSEPTIYYNGKNKEIVYFNVRDKDLFPNLKDLMPGDKKEQEIILKADNIKTDTKFFLEFIEENNSYISNYITIFLEGKELSKENNIIQIANNSQDFETKLKVVIDVPKEAGNEIEDQVYRIDWNILIQEEDSELINVPNTFDNSNIVLYVCMLCISLFVMTVAIIKIKTMNNADFL